MKLHKKLIVKEIAIFMLFALEFLMCNTFNVLFVFNASVFASYFTIFFVLKY